MKIFKPSSGIPDPQYTKDNLREWKVTTARGYSVVVKAHCREIIDGGFLLLTDRTNGIYSTVALFAAGQWTHLTAAPIPEALT